MNRHIIVGTTFVRAALTALAVGGVVLAFDAGEAVASPAAPSGSATASVSPNHLRINQQVKRARARFATDVRAPHAGTPETLSHPSLDTAGAVVADHTGTAPSVLQPARAGVEGTSSSSLLGLDVAGYQGNVDWSQVAAGGAAFAYMKATEGTYYYDGTYFPEQYNGSYAAGLVRGAYHFAIPDNSTGAAQADYFVANGGGWTGDGHTLPGMLDIEYNPYGTECYGLSQSQMVSWIGSFDNEYNSLTGRRPDIYTTADWWSTCTGNSGAFAQESLSIARWSSTPDPLPRSWGTYTIWQFADAGRFPGDQDLFNGSRQTLVEFAAGKPAGNQITERPTAAPRAGDHIGYRLQGGHAKRRQPRRVRRQTATSCGHRTRATILEHMQICSRTAIWWSTWLSGHCGRPARAAEAPLMP